MKYRRFGRSGLMVSELTLGTITSVIIGPRTPGHLDDLISSQNIHLLPEDLAWFDTLVPPGTNVSDHFNTARWRQPNQNHIH
jgi:aryl-alcohol dehydrogenase-like predicted oxidoreductase